MTQRFRGSLVASLFTVACVAAAAASLWRPAADVRTEDRNGDGRPDVWHASSRHGHRSEVTVDTNFDGRSDVYEYYESGLLIRRESDRDFNSRIDLIQEFDPTTREQARSVVDVDFDGKADLLVLFQGGRPVFWKWASPVAPVDTAAGTAPPANVSPRQTNSELAPLADPFAGDLAVRAVRLDAGSEDCVGLSTSGGLPAACTGITSPLASSSDIVDSGLSRLSSATALPYSPRGPPPSHLLG